MEIDLKFWSSFQLIFSIGSNIMTTNRFMHQCHPGQTEFQLGAVQLNLSLNLQEKCDYDIFRDKQWTSCLSNNQLTKSHELSLMVKKRMAMFHDETDSKSCVINQFVFFQLSGCIQNHWRGRGSKGHIDCLFIILSWAW